MVRKKDVQETTPQAQKKAMELVAAKKRTFQVRGSYESDVELTVAAAQGNSQARRDLIDRLLDSVRRTVTYLKGPHVDAEDLAQMALIQILRSAGAFRGECSLEYWADRIAVRTVMKHIHKNRRRERLTAEVWEPARVVRGIDDQASIKRLRVRLASLLQKISPERRTAVTLHHVQGYDLAEISDMTGAPVNTVRDRLRVGRKQLRKHVMRDPMLRDWVDWGNDE